MLGDEFALNLVGAGVDRRRAVVQVDIQSKSELDRLRAAAGATSIKDQRINIRRCTGELRDIQTKALQEGMPYQTLIASVLHK